MNWQSFVAGALVTLIIIFGLAVAFTETPQPTMSGTINTPLTVSPSHINWGIVTVGVPVLRNVTFTNNGQAWAGLNMTYGNASANLVNYNLTWDAEGLTLLSGHSLVANFTLTISEADTTTTNQFSLDIWIGGTATRGQNHVS